MFAPSARLLQAAASGQQGSITSGMWEPQAEKPKSRDVIDHLCYDHRRLESLFRAMRNKSCNREALLQEFSNLLVAHSDAEEKTIYPAVQKAEENAAAGKGEQFESKVEKEHTEGLVVLQALMEEQNIQSSSWDMKLTHLVLGIAQHIDDEEQTVHNKARQLLTPQQREQLGDAFIRAREDNLAANIGSYESVKKLVQERATMMQKIREKASRLV